MKQHQLFDRPVMSTPSIPKGNKVSIRGGMDATPDKLPTEEHVTGIPSAPGVGEKITATTAGGILKKGK